MVWSEPTSLPLVSDADDADMSARCDAPASGPETKPFRLQFKGKRPRHVLDFIPHPLILPVGLAVGVLIAAPVGPVNVLCIQRAIERGVAAGIFAGLGAVLGDGLIALLAALGVGQISSAITLYRDVIQLVGGLVLAGFGVMLSRSRPRLVVMDAGQSEWSGLRDHIWDVPKTFLLTVTNPGAVLGLIAIFGGVSSFVDVRSTAQALWLVAMIVAGSAMWWVFLATMVGRIRHRVTEDRLAQINLAAGLVLVLFGAILAGEMALKSLWRAFTSGMLG